MASCGVAGIKGTYHPTKRFGCPIRHFLEFTPLSSRLYLVFPLPPYRDLALGLPARPPARPSVCLPACPSVRRLAVRPQQRRRQLQLGAARLAAWLRARHGSDVRCSVLPARCSVFSVRWCVLSVLGASRCSAAEARPRCGDAALSVRCVHARTRAKKWRDASAIRVRCGPSGLCATGSGVASTKRSRASGSHSLKEDHRTIRRTGARHRGRTGGRRPAILAGSHTHPLLFQTGARGVFVNETLPF